MRTQKKIIHYDNVFPQNCLTNLKQYLDTSHKRKKGEMHLQVHNKYFDLLLRKVHYSAKLQIAKIHKHTYAKTIKYYPNNGSWLFDFSYKLNLAQNLQLCLGTPYPAPYEYTGLKCVNNMSDKVLDRVAEINI